MKEKKIRESLLIFAIALSAGLLFGTLAWSRSFSNNLEKINKEYFEGSTIYFESKTLEKFFDLGTIKTDGLTEIIPEIRMKANNYDYDDDLHINIIARSNDYNITKLIEGELPKKGKNDAVISSRIAKNLNLKINDKFKLYFGGESRDFTISGIAVNNDCFNQDSSIDFTVLLSYEFLSDNLKVNEKYNFVRAKSSQRDTKDEIEYLQANNPDFSVKELYSEEDINVQVSKTVNTYYLMIIFVILIASTIIIGAKKLIINERISTIGTFFSQGAIKKNIKNILFLEGFVEGILGGILGLLIGFVFYMYINHENSPLKEYGIYEKINIDYDLLPVPIIFAVFISILSCVIPMRKINHMQVKEVILNLQNNEAKKHIWPYIVGIVIFCVGSFVAFWNNPLAVNVSIPAFIFSFIGLLMTYTIIIEKCNGFLLSKMDGNGTVYMIINNLKSSKILQDNIRLLIIASTALALIFTISDSVQEGVVGIYKDLNYDVVCNHLDGADIDEMTNKIQSLDYIDKNQIVTDYSIEGQLNSRTYWIYGVDLDCYDEYNKYIDFKSGEAGEAYNIMKDDPENKIIISDEVKRKLKLNQDSDIEVCINGIVKKYGIAGVINTKMMNMGNGIFIDGNQIHNVFKINYPDAIYLKGVGYFQDDIKNKLKNDIGCYGASIQTKEESIEKDISQTSNLIENLKLFGLICLVMSLFGVLNNLAISFIQRKKEIAVLSSIGMSPKQRFFMLLGESFLSSFFAAFFTITYLFIGANLCSKITRFIGLGLDANIDAEHILIYIGLIVCAGVTPSILVLKKNNKLTVINEIRYE